MLELAGTGHAEGGRMIGRRLAVALAIALLASSCVDESTVGDRPTAGYRDGTRAQNPAGGTSDTHGGTSWGGKGRAGEHKLYTRMK